MDTVYIIRNKCTFWSIYHRNLANSCPNTTIQNVLFSFKNEHHLVTKQLFRGMV